MAIRSLSPKRIQEIVQRHRYAVAVLALMRAKKAVQAQIRAKGQRISDYRAKDISRLAHIELERNWARLIADAEHTIATSSAFVRWRLLCSNLINSAQQPKACSYTTISVQKLGAK